MIWPKDLKLAFAMPLTWPYINKMTHVSLLTMQRPDFVYLDTMDGGDIAEKRERQVEEAQKQGCTHVFILDGDMVYPDRVLIDLFKVLELGADLAGGICYRGYEPYSPIIFHQTEPRPLVPFVDFNFGDIVDAGATGAGCLLVKMEVFNKLEKPWFQFIKEEKTENGITTIIKRGEDTYFTRRATEAGFKLKINTSYDIGHLREVVVDRHFWIIYGILGALGTWPDVFKLFRKIQDKGWVDREIRSLK